MSASSSSSSSRHSYLPPSRPWDPKSSQPRPPLPTTAVAAAAAAATVAAETDKVTRSSSPPSSHWRKGRRDHVGVTTQPPHHPTTTAAVVEWTPGMYDSLPIHWSEERPLPPPNERPLAFQLDLTDDLAAQAAASVEWDRTQGVLRWTRPTAAAAAKTRRVEEEMTPEQRAIRRSAIQRMKAWSRHRSAESNQRRRRQRDAAAAEETTGHACAAAAETPDVAATMTTTTPPPPSDNNRGICGRNPKTTSSAAGVGDAPSLRVYTFLVFCVLAVIVLATLSHLGSQAAWLPGYDTFRGYTPIIYSCGVVVVGGVFWWVMR